ncbi:hypothetical protein L1987_45889 [Smallanthus sonchifolius]|uniref:Uncharacterized protein n=1 Tax=Smallanthus sonchifolius TaxID=185202 RepID=A0ACB9FZA3_9ASTR|nr:hypothetical protein L1987_45889 [Smallanthus sonchifolius]
MRPTRRRRPKSQPLPREAAVEGDNTSSGETVPRYVVYGESTSRESTQFLHYKIIRRRVSYHPPPVLRIGARKRQTARKQVDIEILRGLHMESWWNSHVHTLGLDVANAIPWEEFKEILREEYCPRTELHKLEQEFWNLTMEGAHVDTYTTKFHDYACLCPYMVTPDFKRIERHLWGLAPQILSMVTSAEPATIQSEVRLSHHLTDQAVRQGILVKKGSFVRSADNKRKWDNNHGKTFVPPVQKRQETVKAFAAGPTEKKPRAANLGANRGCFECGSNAHFRKDFPKLKNHGGNNVHGRAFVIGAGEARQDPNIVTGTFLINDHYASILFDTGVDKSFVSSEFSPLLGIKPIMLTSNYTIELADGKLIKTDKVIQGCTLNLADHPFIIDLLPVTLGSFDIIIGMDWFLKNRAAIVCCEKIVRIPLSNGETLSIQGERSGTTLRIITCMKARKCIRKGYHAILAHVIEKPVEERKVKDIPIVRDYPEFFPEDLPGLPPPR